mmetsp:Transcript_10799/g.21139  ORF Transcript_10799/g.21139 Transcript_10799/m.21139 type:complete len:821 (+) Transcript_10799:59-2521(+)
MWQPQPDLLQTVSSLLVEAISSADNVKQREIAIQIDSYSQNPDFSCYLMILMQDQNIPQHIRLAAGHTLKGAIEKVEAYTPETLSFLRVGTETAIYDTAIVSAVRSVAAALFCKHGPWSTLLQHIEVILTENPSVLEILLCVLEDIQGNSDFAKTLDSTEFTQVLKPLIKKVIDAVGVYPTSMKCINQLLFIMPSAMVSQVPAYCEAVLRQLGQIAPEVAESVVVISTMRKDIVLKYFQQFAEYMLACLKTPLAKTACDFWSEWLQYTECLKPYLGRLLEGVVDCLRLTEEDLMDIMPETDSDFRYDKDEEANNWTVRREAAMLMDRLAKAVGGECFNLLQPKIEALLLSTEWKTQECGLLAFGALALGCRQAISPFLPQLMPFLLEKARAEHRLVKSIAIWTLSRFTDDFLSGDGLRTYLQCLMQSVMEQDALVQSAACTAFCILIIRCSREVMAYLPDLLQILAAAATIYHGRALLNLLDAVSSLCDALGEALKEPAYLSLLVSPLLSLWDKTPDNDRALWTLMETFTSLLLAIGKESRPWILAHLERCHRVLKLALQDQLEKQFGVKALELIAMIVEVWGRELFDAFASIMPSVLMSLDDPDGFMKQYACAVIGCVASFVPELAAPAFDPIVEKLAKCLATVPQHQLNSEPVFLCCNNAACALSELAVKYPDAMRPHVPNVLPKMLAAANEPCKMQFFQAYMYCSLSKYSVACPEFFALALPKIIQKWTSNMTKISHGEEKILSYKGVVLALGTNLETMHQCFSHFAEAVVRYSDCPPDLEAEVRHLLLGFKGAVGDAWERYLGGLGFADELLRKYC